MHNRSGRLLLLLTWAVTETMGVQSFHHAPFSASFCIWLGDTSLYVSACTEVGWVTIWQFPVSKYGDTQMPEGRYSHVPDWKMRYPSQPPGSLCPQVHIITVPPNKLQCCFPLFQFTRKTISAVKAVHKVLSLSPFDSQGITFYATMYWRYEVVAKL